MGLAFRLYRRGWVRVPVCRLRARVRFTDGRERDLTGDNKHRNASPLPLTNPNGRWRLSSRLQTGIEMADGDFITYLRVSTQRQDLEQQKVAVERFLNGGNHRTIASFEEKETGKKVGLDNRPQLRAAIDLAKRTGATLLIAKLDRLARNVHFTSGLMEAKVKFVAADNPTANDLTIHIMAAMAEQEAKAISQRTKDRLAVLKANGIRLGNPNNGTAEQTLKANAGAKQKADDYAETVIGEIRKWQAKGITTYKDLADMLTGKIKTPRGEDKWQATQVKRIIERIQVSAPVKAE